MLCSSVYFGAVIHGSTHQVNLVLYNPCMAITYTTIYIYQYVSGFSSNLCIWLLLYLLSVCSVVNKSRLKMISVVHFLLFVLMLFRLSVSLFVMFGMRPPAFLQKLRLPRPHPWEYWWLASILATILALLSLNRNQVFLIKQALLGIIVFGLGPTAFGIYEFSGELMTYMQTRESKHLFHGFPLVVLYNMFLAIALQVHVFGAYFSLQLLKAWGSKGERKKVAWSNERSFKSGTTDT